MKPFNLERALAGDPVVTREGETILIVFDSGLDVEYPLSAWIEGRIESYGFRRNGRYASNDKDISAFDLFMAPKKRTVWVSIYTDKTGGDIGSAVFNNEAEAKSWECPYVNMLAIAVPVEIEG